ncbi:FtsX-like permease family protein [Spirosoma oryzicola]|uniref:FtsX-like permease family protein n=1 Tax=Spirosoma oryzicola TaxID=2898794 RepID=UPI001E37D942|nr:FtsX-like permease family protein [Spirosoma oryzicola]UHG92156.1 ABC transporter permease [Spirosoma oryzicola]
MIQNYAKIALRTLRSQRSYTLLNVVGLTVGMAGGLLIFLFIHYHLSTDRHHAKFDRIFRVVTDLHLEDGSVEYYPEAPLPMAQKLRTAYAPVEQAAYLKMIRELTVSIQRSDQTTPVRFLEHKSTAFVEPELFGILDYQWVRGNPKTALREPNSVVLTESWARRYFGNADPMGQTLNLNHRADATVTGILADPPKTTDTDINLFVSLPTIGQLDPGYDRQDWGNINSTDRIFVALKSPESGAEMEAAMPALLKTQFGKMARFYRFHFQPLADVHFDVKRIVGGAVRSSLLWSLGLVGLFLVLTACINFVNLATAQAIRRSKEVGIRKTLGSTRGQLVRQFLFETVLIVVAAAILALLLVLVTLPLFNQWLSSQLALQLDWPTIGFVVLLFGSIVGLAGGYPAAVLSGFSPWAALKGSLPARAGGNYSLRQGLIVVQFVVCQALIVGAMVVATQVRYMREADLGFNKDNVVMVALPDNQKNRLETLRNELLQYPEIKSVSVSRDPPSGRLLYGGSFKLDNKADWEAYPIRERIADANYLNTYGLRLVAGRNIIQSDTIQEYLVNEAFLQKIGVRNPQQILGRKLHYHLSKVPLPIVGVVKDFHQRSLHEQIGPCLIASYAPFFRQAGIRVSGQNSEQTLDQIRKTWEQLFPNEVFEYSYLDEQLAKFYETESLVFRLVNIFAGIAILICCLGLYGLVSYAVVQRRKEIGVRKVLGASVASIVSLLSGDFLKLVLLAIVVASPIAWWAMNQWLQDFAYRIDLSWWMFALAGVLATGIAFLTVSLQSVKAARVNPVKSLRSE